MKRLFGLTRFLVVLGVLSGLLLATVLFVAGLLEALAIVAGLVGSIGEVGALKKAAIAAIQVADEILIAAAMYIISAGLYELFIGKADLPDWLTIRTFDDLKDRLLGVSAAVLVVSFVELVAIDEPDVNLLESGLAIAAVIIAIGVFSYLFHRGRGNGHLS